MSRPRDMRISELKFGENTGLGRLGADFLLGIKPGHQTRLGRTACQRLTRRQLEPAPIRQLDIADNHRSTAFQDIFRTWRETGRKAVRFAHEEAFSTPMHFRGTNAAAAGQFGRLSHLYPQSTEKRRHLPTAASRSTGTGQTPASLNSVRPLSNEGGKVINVRFPGQMDVVGGLRNAGARRAPA